jgi:hypothetical protein
MANTWFLDKIMEQLHQAGIEGKSLKADSVCQLIALSSIATVSIYLNVYIDRMTNP